VKSDGSTVVSWLALLTLFVLAAAATLRAHEQQETLAGGGPVIVIETARGAIEIETFPEDAPTSVAHVLGLIERGFYDGLRFHRVEPGFVVQFGDPRSRDMAERDRWGRAPGDGSGAPVGRAEITRRRTHRAGTVAMAHPGDPSLADSQIYIALAELPRLDGRFTILGHVVEGMDVVASLRPADEILRVRVKGSGTDAR
jgi:peptidyl-prolyl cis-trans isomerase B (cyclophilin B)